jgi:hypothetical protein
MARTLHVPIGGLVDTLRVALLVAPVAVGLLTWATCRRLPRLPTGPEPP